MSEALNVGGACACGLVKFSANLPEAKFHICHCSICRKHSGGPQMATLVNEAPMLSSDGTLVWYKSSDWAERGFCGTCGTNLFWRLADEPDAMTGISIEVLDNVDDLELSQHIFIDEKSKHYDFKDDCPRLTGAEVIAEMTGDEV